jgi:hypothetical protein
MKRPFGVTVLAILAGIAAFLAGVHMLQSLGLFPIKIGPFSPHVFNLWGAFMWGLMLWVWCWLVQMLWKVDPGAWLFLVVIATFNLILDFTYLLGQADWQDVQVSFIVNGLILIYCMLPGVRNAFGTTKA